MPRTAAELMWEALRAEGAEVVFGLPGSQTIAPFQALKRSGLRTVVPTHEMAAAFMANGYGRVTGRPGILTTIPGPGFTYALTGLAEAWLDSAPLLHVVPAAREVSGREHALQAIGQREMARPIVKRILHADAPCELATASVAGYRLAAAGEPGPVLVEAREDDFGAEVPHPAPVPAGAPAPAAPDALVTEIAAAIADAGRVLLYLGAGAQQAERQVQALIDAAAAVVVTTTSGRGTISEDDPRVIVRDPGLQDTATLAALIDRADLVLAVGCKFSHNGAAGFHLRIPQEKLVSINAAGPSGNYPARLHATADARRTLAAILERLPPEPASRTGWDVAELASWRSAALRNERDARIEPQHEASGRPSSELVNELRSALPDDAIVVTDSGFHQMSVRRHFTVRSPHGLLVPTNFQSMGYALPAAIGAAIGAPSRRVVVVVGDGGMLMSGLELATAVRERVPLTVVVFNDGAYTLIRNPQLAAYGESHGTELPELDFEALAAATGADYRRAGPEGLAAAIGETEGESSVRLVEVPLGESPGLGRVRRRGKFRAFARRVLSSGHRRRLAGWLRR